MELCMLRYFSFCIGMQGVLCGAEPLTRALLQSVTPIQCPSPMTWLNETGRETWGIGPVLVAGYHPSSIFSVCSVMADHLVSCVPLRLLSILQFLSWSCLFLWPPCITCCSLVGSSLCVQFAMPLYHCLMVNMLTDHLVFLVSCMAACILTLLLWPRCIYTCIT